MKKTFSILFSLISLSVIGIASVAAAPLGSGPDDCSRANPFYDSAEFTTGSTTDSKQALIYDLTKVDMEGDTLAIYGWAFSSRLDTLLGSTGKVDFILRPEGGGTDIPMTVQYADAGSKCAGSSCGTAPKFYDYTYWNCIRTAYNPNTNGGYCIHTTPKVTDNVHGDTSPILQGGFKATYDLSTLETGKKYHVMMKFTHTSPRNTISDAYKDVTAALKVVSETVKNYSGTSKEGKELSINVSGFQSQAKMVVSKARLTGTNGLYCSSPAGGNDIAKKSRTYFQHGKSYEIGEVVERACRGGAENCDSTGAGQINIYPLKVNTDGSPGSAATAYAPASWINFEGSIIISTQSTETPEIPAPAVCTDTGKIYYFYYFFLAGVNNSYNGWMHNSGSGTKFGDADILKELGINNNSEVATEGGVLQITKKNLEWYYQKYMLAQSGSNSYYKEGNNYYIKPIEWCDESNGECHASSVLTEPISSYMRASVDLDVTPNGDLPLKMQRTAASSGLGYEFTIDRYFQAHPEGRRSLQNNNVMAVQTAAGQLLHPAVYQITLCPSDTPNCEDSVESAVCLDNDQGTHVVFHENDDKAACTLVHGTESGFTIIESEETNDYCTVACKDDLDIELPGSKQTAAGQYFLLDNYIPKITAKRTCVTSKVDNDKFEADLKELEAVMPKEYNAWQDYLDHYNFYSSQPKPVIDTSKDVYYYEERKTCTAKCAPTDAACLADPPEKDYIVQHYTIGSDASSGRAKYEYHEAVPECDLAESSDPSFERTTGGMSIDAYARSIKTTKKDEMGEYTREVETCSTGGEEHYVMYESWKINRRDRATGRPLNDLENAWPGDSGDWIASSPCSEGGTTYTEGIDLTIEDTLNNTRMHWGKYMEYHTRYEEIINRYNTCFNWTDQTINMSHTGGENETSEGPVFQKSPTTSYDRYKFGFRPEVTFNYDDEDRKSFNPRDDNTTYKYEYGTDDVIGDGDGYTTYPDTETAYWAKGEEVDAQYTGGAKQSTTGQKGLNSTPRDILNCTGTSCSMSEDGLATEFYTSAYLSRTEEISYEYHLPKLYTSVPDGRSINRPEGNKKHLELDDEAVPVNINTLAGTYPYRLTIKDVKDDLRRGDRDPQIASNNPDDTFEDRFNEKALNDGENYVCNYDVINDIYIPGPGPKDKRFNFFYRTIDDSNINPLGRVLGYNWSDEKGSQVKEKVEELSSDYMALTDGSTTDRFVFRLTPTVMADIRKYNARQNRNDDGYADWDLVCDDYDQGGYHCNSNFLNCLSGGYGERRSGLESCSSIFETTYGYLGADGYSDSDFLANRQKLKNKQNSIDGRG